MSWIEKELFDYYKNPY